MQTPEEYEVSQRVGQLIQGLKHRRGMSKETICQHLGISTRTLDNYLSGVSSFKLGTLLKFADLCRIRLADILDETEALSRLHPHKLKDKFSILIVCFSSIWSLFFFENIILIILCVLFFYANKDKNSQSVIGIFVIAFMLEVIVAYCLKFIIFPAVESYYFENIYAFGLQLCINLLLLFMLKNRAFLSVLVTRGRSASVLERSPIEASVYFLVLTLASVDFLALMENFLRNLERLGVEESVAKAFWEVTFFYDYFEYLKAAPTWACVMVLFTAIIARKDNKASLNSW
ncbi:helix-turn-helix transcriptional regulator [Pseudoalteromonas sp. SCSIO 43201]|uniref:helix-turn-helix domain-containing protein n=1 Tax=Pseudoalteromonas sp. SCSIO 43201 TaxID=2822842 RepID=UPI002075E45A|nr:helix-turn-helix transcriptional regulator [Pseudoalteromonas sp. SCSIO 43201]USD30287.1 helix-turn-helix transcriptional regulator [Pseudoalteromonas sp. SCSIO 43201]